MMPFPFITGCQRSGTTLLRMMLDAHPAMSVPRESHFIPDLVAGARRGFDVDRALRTVLAHERFRRWDLPEADVRAAVAAPPPVADVAAFVRRLFALHAERASKERYADKTPRYATEIPLLARLFPEARFIHVIRDGRDVALSLLEVEWGPRSIDRAATYWARRVRAAMAAGEALGPERYLAYHHEDLVADPEAVLRRICDFIELPFDPTMLRYHEQVGTIDQRHAQHLAAPPTPGLRDWRTQMSRSDQRVFELLAGDLLAELGYPVVTDPSTLGDGEAAAKARAGRVRRWEAFTEWAPYRALRQGPVGRGAAAAVRPVTRALTRRVARGARSATIGGGDG